MIFKRLLSYLKPYKKSIYFVIIIIIFSTLFSLFIPKLLGNFISSLYQSITTNTPLNTSYLYSLILIISSLYVFNIITTYFENYLMSNICEKALNKLKNDANEKLSKLKIKYYDTHQTGEILTYINNDIDALSSLFLQIIPSITKYIITIIGITIIMFTINITLTLITLTSLPLSLIFNKFFFKLARKKYHKYYTKNSYLNSLIEESYHYQETISLYNNDKQITNSFNTLNRDIVKTSMQANLITSIATPLSTLINYFVYFIIIILGSKYVFVNKLLIGDIQSLIQYTKQLSSPINSFNTLFSSIQSSLASSKRVFTFLDEEEEKHVGNKQLKQINKIEFKNTCFSYNDSPFINNLNLTINKGEKIALVGETGSGKSTIINLLMQFYKINKGDILINDESISTYNITSFYDKISLIPQNIWLKNDTIKNNLLYGNKKLDDQQLIQICKSTNVLPCINNLTNKFDELLNEDDIALSEGEKQLLVITRSLIKNSDLLILDESTSNIDSKNESLIQEVLNNLTNKTTIIIAHRLSTIVKADKIIVMKDGNIIEVGTHQSLSKEKGEYYSFLQTL